VTRRDSIPVIATLQYLIAFSRLASRSELCQLHGHCASHSAQHNFFTVSWALLDLSFSSVHLHVVESQQLIYARCPSVTHRGAGGKVSVRVEWGSARTPARPVVLCDVWLPRMGEVEECSHSEAEMSRVFASRPEALRPQRLGEGK
jgi:hypothetical protein